MAITLSVVVILGVLLALLIRYKSLGIGAALVAVLFGFYLANTNARHTINDLTTAVTQAISGH
ncbi:hypothetical protein SAMN06272775_4656 [Streptomyces sp. 2323.1]|uniref:hypothetical protein n=1 Tax=Streptomyces sp. 2323.1 TaxID=1938841 RepID=UPI000BB743F2|nr:hypothetical protein [Streptomyces sp. 2323.1]SOE13680.1 hypothetical protein SAMN06272775_4656 [Streptomyces sp. 2323.1]